MSVNPGPHFLSAPPTLPIEPSYPTDNYPSGGINWQGFDGSVTFSTPDGKSFTVEENGNVTVND